MFSQEDFVNESIKKKFFDGVRSLFVAVASTIVRKFSFGDPILDDLAILFPENQAKISAATVLTLADRFPSAVPESALDELEEEMLVYALISPETLPISQVRTEKPSKSEEL